jgi:hypothetical protein
MLKTLAIAGALVLAGCGTLGRYTGDEYYYTENGVYWSCREPMPYKGGTCMPEALWGAKK